MAKAGRAPWPGPAVWWCSAAPVPAPPCCLHSFGLVGPQSGPGAGSISRWGTPCPRSLLPCPWTGNFAKQSPLWTPLRGLAGPPKALWAEFLQLNLRLHCSPRAPYFEVHSHLWVCPLCESWCVWLPRLPRMTSPTPCSPGLSWSPDASRSSWVLAGPMVTPESWGQCGRPHGTPRPGSWESTLT